MKILLDTHVIVWYFDGDKRLPLKARCIIEDQSNEIYFSSLSIFEVDLKHMNHPEQMPYSGDEILNYCQQVGFKPLPLDIKHALAVKTLTRKEDAPPHRDPFDRLMICQAIVEDMLFITHDERIAEYVSPMIFKI